MPAAIFDIDGTLTDTAAVDVECYEEAIRALLGVEIPADWESFDEITDSAILATACRLHGCAIPDRQTEQRIALRVGELLEAALGASAERFRPNPGAGEIFTVLRDAGWSVAMATGAWRASAIVKLRGARIPWDGVPLASSSDHTSRAGILRHALGALGGASVAPVVCFGDGVWDGRAARSLGFTFIGIGRGDRAASLQAAGAHAVLPDLGDGASIMTVLGALCG